MPQDFTFSTVGQSIAAQGNYLLYGESGIGKTYALSTVENILVLDIERGSRSLPPTMPLVTSGEIRSAFDSPADQFPSFVVDRPSLNDVADINDLLMEPRYEGRFQALAVDTVTTLLDLVVAWVIENHSRTVVQATQPDKGGKGTKTLTLAGWGMAQQVLRDLVIPMCDMPIHTIFTFHEEMMDGPDGRSRWTPKIQGKKLLPQMQALVDFGFRMEMMETKARGEMVRDRAIRCLPATGAWAKCRDWKGGVFSEYEAPNLGALLRKIEAAVTTGNTKHEPDGALA